VQSTVTATTPLSQVIHHKVHLSQQHILVTINRLLAIICTVLFTWKCTKTIQHVLFKQNNFVLQERFETCKLMKNLRFKTNRSMTHHIRVHQRSPHSHYRHHRPMIVECRWPCHIETGLRDMLHTAVTKHYHKPRSTISFMQTLNFIISTPIAVSLVGKFWSVYDPGLCVLGIQLAVAFHDRTLH